MKNDEPNNIISFAEFELDTVRRRLTREGETVALHARAFDLLNFLIQNNGRIVTKDEIFGAVWDRQFVEESNLVVQISNLRKALGETKNAPRFLVTVPGKGYKFAADARENTLVIETHSVSELTIEQNLEFIDRRPLLPNKSAFNFSSFGIIVVAILVFSVVGAIGGFWFLNQTKGSGDENPSVLDIKRLTAKGNIVAGVLSPDGKFFAYTPKEKGLSATAFGWDKRAVTAMCNCFPKPMILFIYRARFRLMVIGFITRLASQCVLITGRSIKFRF